MEKVVRENERTSLLRQLAEAKEKLKTREVERDSALDQLKKGNDAWVEEVRASQAKNIKVACKKAIREFKDSNKYKNFMDHMQNRGYMLAIRHVEARFPDDSFDLYELHSNMDELPMDV